MPYLVTLMAHLGTLMAHIVTLMAGTTKTLLYTLPRRVVVGCSRVLMEWFVWM